MAELRVRDLDDSATKAESAVAISDAGECAEEQVKVGAVRGSYDGLSTSWVRCPVGAANKVAAAARITIGWAICRVQLLAARPLQCFKCMKRGHVGSRCPNGGVGRTELCYRCGRPGHRAAACKERVRCPTAGRRRTTGWADRLVGPPQPGAKVEEEENRGADHKGPRPQHRRLGLPLIRPQRA
ncbi:uncharacterized protein LOC105840007 [Monomorium pharaonis]|uniref:uncharacterized protein LOC105840007 n=1 Tax=Monomorium pharaonis TaxID=307658 RepID=UPI00063F0046|nr:uncharacterized protein LOC105840007 [Monomorium pharaonis]